MRNRVLCLLAAMALAPAAFAADTCTVRVTTTHARGDGLRLKADAQTPGLYTAVVPTNEAFAATVLADAGYTLYREKLPGEAETVLPDGVRFDAVFGRLEIPAAVLAANAATGIDLSVAAKPITYTIRYHAHGDGEPAPGAAGASLEGVAGDARSWTQAVDAAEGGGKVVLATTGSLQIGRASCRERV